MVILKINPGSKKYSIKFFHWNLNCLANHDFIKVPLIEAFIITHNFGILCLSETFLESAIDLNDGVINKGHSVLRADHPSNSRCGAGCLYIFQTILTINQRRWSYCNAKNHSHRDFSDETCFFTCFYRSPSQDHDELDNFWSELYLTNITNNQFS